MATESIDLNTFTASTFSERRPDLVDNFFGSAPFWAWMRRRMSIKLQGGRNIKETSLYKGVTAKSFGKRTALTGSFDTAIPDFASELTFEFSFNYAAANVSGVEEMLNDGPRQVFSIVDATFQNAEISLVDQLSTQVNASGGGLDMDGFGNAISRNTGVTYGGVTRSTTAGTQGAAIRSAVEDTGVGALTLALLNTAFGTCTVGQERPDLIVTTQTLKNNLWVLSQSSERNAPEDTRDLGFSDLRFNGAAVTVDSHTVSGFINLLNTKWWRLYVHTRGDFRLRQPGSKVEQWDSINQVIFVGDAVCVAPRLQGSMAGVS